MAYFTIITATRDAERTLPGLLASLAAQTCRDFTHIVQDGGSRDATVAVARAHAERLPELRLESAPDAGIYDAWNTALAANAASLGEWVLFLGADDRLAAPDTLTRARALLEGLPPAVRFASAKALLEDRATGRLLDISGDAATVPGDLPKRMPVPHTALFHRASLFSSSRFDASFRIAGDYDFVARHWTAREHGANVDLLVTIMGDGGLSVDPAHLPLCREETRRVQRTFFPVRHRIHAVRGAAWRLWSRLRRPDAG
ncbi:MAG: glycosyltransferase [Desulfovibrio sp.]|nr:glycosyltransferase [Desulfovibrio sp.]